MTKILAYLRLNIIQLLNEVSNKSISICVCVPSRILKLFTYFENLKNIFLYRKLFSELLLILNQSNFVSLADSEIHPSLSPSFFSTLPT